MRVVHGARCPWGELSVGRTVRGASCPWGKLSMGRTVRGVSCRGASCRGASYRGASYRGANFDEASCSGTVLDPAMLTCVDPRSAGPVLVHARLVYSMPVN
jgi:hypothetical protein